MRGWGCCFANFETQTQATNNNPPLFHVHHVTRLPSSVFDLHMGHATSCSYSPYDRTDDAQSIAQQYASSMPSAAAMPPPPPGGAVAAAAPFANLGARYPVAASLSADGGKVAARGLGKIQYGEHRKEGARCTAHLGKAPDRKCLPLHFWV